jgi:endoglucanase
MNVELLKKLCDAPGVPGAEEPVKEIFLTEIRKYTDEVYEDHIGNIIAHIGGDGPRLVLDGHLDEVGFMVKHIDDQGFLSVIPLGGVDPRVFYGQRVIVWGRKPLVGVVGAVPPHLSKGGQTAEAPDIEDCLIDLGLEPSKVVDNVRLGDPVTFATELRETEDAVISKAIDNRVSLFVILEALSRRPRLGCDLYVTATVQEEVGLRGARTINPAIEPEFSVVLEGTVSNSLPGVPGSKQLARALSGPEIRLSDKYIVTNRALSFFIYNLGKRLGIPCQLVVKRQGGTNASAFQVTGKGTRSTVVSVPVRYLHSPSSVAFKSDILHTVHLIAATLESIGGFDPNAVGPHP